MRKYLMLSILFIFMGAKTCFAESSWKHELEVGAEISHIKYEEPSVMNEKGMMYGILGSYAMHRNKLMLKADGRFSYGEVDYKGQLSDGTAYNVNGITDYVLETRFLVGYDYLPSEKATVTPYTGLGYRYLNDDLGKDPKGYERESNYFYSPIGIDASTDLGKGWLLGITAEYDLFWYGIQRTHLGDVYTGVDVVNNYQDRGYGARGSIKVQKKTGRVNFLIEPFIRYWNIKQSRTSAVTFAGTYIIGYAYEPKNNSTEYGIKVAAKF